MAVIWRGTPPPSWCEREPGFPRSTWCHCQTRLIDQACVGGISPGWSAVQTPNRDIQQMEDSIFHVMDETDYSFLHHVSWFTFMGNASLLSLLSGGVDPGIHANRNNTFSLCNEWYWECLVIVHFHHPMNDIENVFLIERIVQCTFKPFLFISILLNKSENVQLETIFRLCAWVKTTL